MNSSRLKIRTQGAFSLVELMVVLTITALLAVLATSGFRTLLNGDSLDTGTSAVYNYLTLARTDAISLRTPVQVRIATDLWQVGGVNDTSSCYRRLSLWQLQQSNPANPDDTTWVPTWVQLTPWQKLGSSIVFESAADPTGTYTFTSTGSSPTTPTGYTYFCNATYSTISLNSGPAAITAGQSAGNNITADWVALEFLPTGALNVGTTGVNVYLLLTPGSYNGTSLSYTQKTKSNWSQIRINSLIGTFSVVRP